MSGMAREYGAINLSQGFPDFEVSAALIDLIHQYMKKGMNQYAPMPGLPALRESIAEMLHLRHGVSIHPEKEITITAGATEALFSAITALVRPGDEVLVFDPAYDSYDPAIRLSGGVPVHIPLTVPEFGVDWDLVRASITERTRLIIINTPHNPSGSILWPEDMEELELLVEEYGLYVISDEVYEWIIFDEEDHESALKYPTLRQNCVVTYSFGKTFHATGWKVGYLIAPEHLTNEIRKIHQFITFSVNTPLQYALAEYILKPENYSYLPSFYQKKRDYFLDVIKGSRLRPLKCRGTYFLTVSYADISDQDDMDMATELTQEYGVAAIPVSAFYGDRTDHKLLRFCFAKSEETLQKAGEILCKI
jgi:methionine transaminase